MKPEIKEKWLAALKSGKYKQGKHALCRTNDDEKSFCCLGVLCDLHRKTKKKKGFIWQQSDSKNDLMYNGSASYLPIEVQKWAGIGRKGSFNENGTAQDLASVNDNTQGNTFKAVIEKIEKFF